MGTEDHCLLADRYLKGALLGKGGSACVYDGYDTRLERPVAIKQLRPEVAADVPMRRRFEQEARTAARLTHPNAVAVYDIGEDDGQTYLVMERLPGRSLADRIAQGPLAPADAAAVGVDVLAALRAAHTLGMVHRDVKPGNILLTDEGEAKVADFGIATRFGSPTTDAVGDGPPPDDTVGGQVVGTPAYLAPERRAGLPATPRSDLFAVGVVLFEALTGHKPGAAPLSLPGAPAPLAAVVLRALAPWPEDRYPSAAEMASALRTAWPAVSARTTSPVVAGSSPTAAAGCSLDVVSASPASASPAAEPAVAASPVAASPAAEPAVSGPAVSGPAVGHQDTTRPTSIRAYRWPARETDASTWRRLLRRRAADRWSPPRRRGDLAGWHRTLRNRPAAFGLVMGLAGLGFLGVALAASATPAPTTESKEVPPVPRHGSPPNAVDRPSPASSTTSTTTSTTAPPSSEATAPPTATPGTLAPTVLSHDAPWLAGPSATGAGGGPTAAGGPPGRGGAGDSGRGSGSGGPSGRGEKGPGDH